MCITSFPSYALLLKWIGLSLSIRSHIDGGWIVYTPGGNFESPWYSKLPDCVFRTAVLVDMMIVCLIESTLRFSRRKNVNQTIVAKRCVRDDSSSECPQIVVFGDDIYGIVCIHMYDIFCKGKTMTFDTGNKTREAQVTR